MAIQQQLHSVDTLWELTHAPENDSKRFYLIDGELFEMSPVNRTHARLTSLLIHFLQGYVLEKDLGEVHMEAGYHAPNDRTTLLAPDVAFVSHERLSKQPEDKFLSVMPDLAVESHLALQFDQANPQESSDLFGQWRELGLDCPACRQRRRCLPFRTRISPRYRICWAIRHTVGRASATRL